MLSKNVRGDLEVDLLRLGTIINNSLNLKFGDGDGPNLWSPKCIQKKFCVYTFFGMYNLSKKSRC